MNFFPLFFVDKKKHNFSRSLENRVSNFLIVLLENLEVEFSPQKKSNSIPIKMTQRVIFVFLKIITRLLNFSTKKSNVVLLI